HGRKAIECVITSRPQDRSRADEKHQSRCNADHRSAPENARVHKSEPQPARDRNCVKRDQHAVQGPACIAQTRAANGKETPTKHMFAVKESAALSSKIRAKSIVDPMAAQV